MDFLLKKYMDKFNLSAHCIFPFKSQLTAQFIKLCKNTFSVMKQCISQFTENIPYKCFMRLLCLGLFSKKSEINQQVSQ